MFFFSVVWSVKQYLFVAPMCRNETLSSVGREKGVGIWLDAGRFGWLIVFFFLYCMFVRNDDDFFPDIFPSFRSIESFFRELVLKQRHTSLDSDISRRDWLPRFISWNLSRKFFLCLTFGYTLLIVHVFNVSISVTLYLISRTLVLVIWYLLFDGWSL